MKKVLLIVWLLLSTVLSVWGYNPDKTLRSMTLREKIAQLFIVTVYKPGITKSQRKLLNKIKPGGIIFLSNKLKDALKVKKTCDILKRLPFGWRLKIPMFLSVDQEGGRVNRMYKNIIRFPSVMAVAATGKIAFAYKVGRYLGEQLSACGINVNFGPVLDVNYNKKNPIIGVRSFSDDPDTVINFARAYMKGLKDSGIIAFAKHFPGHGRTSQDSHLTLPYVNISWDKLIDNDFRVFNAFSAYQVPGIMTAHIMFKKISKHPATLSKKFITGLIRKYMRYTGLVITDEISMKALSKNYSYKNIVKRAVNAGCDLLCVSLPLKRIDRLISSVHKMALSGKIRIRAIDRAVRRILNVKYGFGLFKNKTISDSKALKIFTSKKIKKLVAGIAEQSVTLVKDPGKIFPLKAAEKILLISSNPYFLKQSQLYLKKKRQAAEIKTILSPKIPSFKNAVNIYKKAESYDLVIFAGKSRREALIARYLSKYRKKRIVFAALKDPYFASGVGGRFAYIAAFNYQKRSIDACARAIAGIISFSGKSPVKIF
ncbi:MAG: beta-N-acetylhexosaminidase [Spirochaetes bacterium]|nr:beta-N-acetylhexosaminidase [Spirochaetota bacterium]